MACDRQGCVPGPPQGVPRELVWPCQDVSSSSGRSPSWDCSCQLCSPASLPFLKTLITGKMYQGSESPGRHLLRLVRGCH